MSTAPVSDTAMAPVRPMSDHGVVDVAAIAVQRNARWVVLPAFVVGAICAGMVTLHWLDRDAGVPTWWMGSLTIAAGLGASGALLVHRLPDNPIGWLMLVGGIAQGLVGLGREWAVYATIVRAGDVPGAAWAALVGSALWTVSIATLPLVLMTFPDGTLPSRRWRRVVQLVVVATVLGSLTQAVTPGPFTEDLPTIVNPIGVQWVGLDPLAALVQLVLTGAMVAAVLALVVRTRGSAGVLRQQLRWVMSAGALLGLALALELLPIRMTFLWLDWLDPTLLLVFLASITVSVLRWRLWDIDVIISRSLVYGLLTVVLGGAFVTIVAISGRLRNTPVDYGSSLVAAAVVAVAFAPIRDHLQHRIDRWIYGDRGDPYRALARLGTRLGGDAGPDDSVLHDVVEAVATSLRLARVAIVGLDGATLAVVGADVPGSSTPDTLPLEFRTRPVGALVVTSRPGSSLGRRERTVLTALAPLVSVVVHAAAVTDALQRSRRAIVTTREEERLRVRRDLHDGLGPALASVRMQLDGASLLVDHDPERAKSVLDHLSDDIRTTIADIRRLVYGLRPPALDELGLHGALRELTDSFSGPSDSGSDLRVDLVAVDELGTLPAACEVAAFRIVSESLNNVARHATASHCRVAIVVHEGSTIDVTIDDDGSGCVEINAERSIGIGLRSMIERAAEVGGSLRIGRSPLGGTRVHACLPIASLRSRDVLGDDARSGRAVSS